MVTVVSGWIKLTKMVGVLMEIDKIVFVNAEACGYGPKDVQPKFMTIPEEIQHECLEVWDDVFWRKAICLSQSRRASIGTNIEVFLEVSDSSGVLELVIVEDVLGDLLTAKGTIASSNV
jgi:hypothetical protein